jgi:hypothetical protein
MVARISVFICAALLLGHGAALAQNESLLSGRYAFTAQGNRSPNRILSGDHVSRVGTIRFDGSGNVTNVRFRETVDGRKQLFGPGSTSLDIYHFVSGTYAVGANGHGRIELHFDVILHSGSGSGPALLDEVWEIALASGGKSFFLDVDESIDIVGLYSENEEVTISGEARAN